jgi:hypothetical protein
MMMIIIIITIMVATMVRSDGVCICRESADLN